jgi:hypothetical protein
LEPAVRPCYLALLSVFASLPAMAVNFQTPLENIEWSVAGDQFECRLGQPVNNFGRGEFVRKAGEQAVFRLTGAGSALGNGSATLYAAAAAWQPGRGDVSLGSVRLGRGEVLFTSSQSQASGLLNGLLDGRGALIRGAGEGGRPVQVRLPAVRFAKAYNDYQACAAKLLTVQLDAILAYMKADPTVNRVELDGHSDNSGNRLVNRDLSRRRAMAVADYLKSQGIAEEQITLRFHGEQYPLVPNTNAGNRARNRRVNVQLERGPAVEKVAPAAVAAAPAASTAPTAPSPAVAAPVAAATAGQAPAKP